MRAQRIRGLSQFELVEIDKPVSKDGNVVVKIETVGICGTDLHLWEDSEYAKGWILGHECAGYVEDPGNRDDLQVGNRVFVIPGNPCGGCVYCRNNQASKCLNAKEYVGIGLDGAYAEYMTVRSDMVMPLSDEISFDEASMVEPAAVCNRVSKNANIQEGEQVVIAGCGIIGLLTAIMCKKRGASRIVMTDVNEYRLQTAADMGIADTVLNAADEGYISGALAMTEGHLGFDKCVDCVGNADALNTNIRITRAEGEILMAGYPTALVPMDIAAFVDKELAMKSSFGYEAEEIIEVMGMIESREVDLKQFITRHIKLEELQEMFERLTNSDNREIKVIVNPHK
jgi:L-iditol 2-dehydrogenase